MKCLGMWLQLTAKLSRWRICSNGLPFLSQWPPLAAWQPSRLLCEQRDTARSCIRSRRQPAGIGTVELHFTCGSDLSSWSQTMADNSKKYAVFQLPGSSGNSSSQQPRNLHEAAEQGNAAYINRVVQRSLDLDINATDHLQRTALHWAAEMGHVEVVEILMDYGADAFITECNGRTALHLAARGADAKMLSSLLELLEPAQREKIINMPDNYGLTPVFLTKQKGEPGQEAFEVLMKNGGKYNGISIKGGAAVEPPVAAPVVKAA